MIIKVTCLYDEKFYINTNYIVFWRECRFAGTDIIGSSILLTSGDVVDVTHSPEEIRAMIPSDGW
jgi:hypothetical protein